MRSYSSSSSWKQSDYYRFEQTLQEEKLELAPLIDHLKHYDALRLRLEKDGGTAEDLEQITSILGEPVTMVVRSHPESAPLTDPDSLRRAVSLVGWGHYFLDIRKLSRGLPAYCLSRVVRDYWSEYSLVVEDLYLSPGFPFADERFARLMHMGHETAYLRMSPFRSAIKLQCGDTNTDPDEYADNVLYDLGHYCLAAMWHEDQRPAVAAAQYFGLPRFRQAIELLYLCLSTDLCVLRSHISENMISFFRDVYPQPAVSAFLHQLQTMDGQNINKLPQSAVTSFRGLNKLFREFLETNVPWEGLRTRSAQTSLTFESDPRGQTDHLSRVPIYKLLFANLYRLDLVAESLLQDEMLGTAVAKLEGYAGSIIEQINGQEANNQGVATSGRTYGTVA